MGTRWASNTGSTIIGSLNIDTIAWQSGTTVRYTFSGSPDLSGVVVGHQLQATGCTNALHNGTFEITAVSNASDYIEVTNTAISDASNDESSSPGTGTAKTGASLVQEPTSAKQALGWLNGEKPPAGYFNWQAQNSGRVQVEKVIVGYSTISTATPTALGGEGRNVCPFTSADIAQVIPTTSAEVDLTDTVLTVTPTASNAILFGYTFSADSSALPIDNAFRIYFNGSAAAAGYRQNMRPALTSAVSGFYPVTGLSALAYPIKMTGTCQSGSTVLTVDTGRFWGIEIPAATSLGTTASAAGFNSNSTSYVDLYSSVTISPTNNPVLLLCSSVVNPNSSPTNFIYFRFTDGSTNWGEWLSNEGDDNKTQNTMAWVTGDLNGSKTFKVQTKNDTLTASDWYDFSLTAIEITGDLKTRTPSGTCTISSTEANVTDGSTACTQTFTPGANIYYLAVFTGYLERTAGSGSITLKLKVDSTEILTIPHAAEGATTHKTPFTLMVPTGTLASGVSTTISARALTSDGGTTYTIKNVGFWLIEAAVLTSSNSGDPASLTFTDVQAGPIEVNYRSVRDCSADDDLTLGLYANVNSGGFTLLADSVQTINAPGTAPQAVHYYHLTDSYNDGDNVVLELRADIDSGSVIFEEGILTGKEVLKA